MRIGVFFLLFSATNSFASDTLFTHPKYPPIVYQNGEYNFYKYNPKYIPDNLLHCFKILGTTGMPVLTRFSERSTDEVIERGIFDRGYRVRKEFCLESYSPFSQYFHSVGIYSPHAMETYILLAFHQYLRGEGIKWHQNKKMALQDLKKENKSWKRRAEYFYRLYSIRRNDIEKEVPDFDPSSMEDVFFNW